MDDARFNFTGSDRIIEEFFENLYGMGHFNSAVLVTLYVPTFLLSVTGNALVIYVVVTRRYLRSVKNYLLINLACADLMITCVCVPTAISSIVYRPWIYGDILCRVSFFAQGVAVAASIFTLTVMSIHRFHSLRYGERIRTFSQSCHVLSIILAVWVASALFLVPILFVRHLNKISLPSVDSVWLCVEMWPNDDIKVWFCLVCLLVIYIIPAAILSVCYLSIGRTIYRKSGSRRRQNQERPYVTPQTLTFRRAAARKLVILVAIFLACWLPYNIVSLVSDVTGTVSSTGSLPYVLWLGHAHSAMNPVMYWCLNARLRRECVSVITCRRHDIHHNARKQRARIQREFYPRNGPRHLQVVGEFRGVLADRYINRFGCPV